MERILLLRAFAELRQHVVAFPSVEGSFFLDLLLRLFFGGISEFLKPRNMPGNDRV